MKIILLVCSLLILAGFLYLVFKKRKPLTVPGVPVIRDILQRYVLFYQKLGTEEKAVFEQRVQKFLQQTTITGVETNVEDEDRIFIAAAAIIPIFAFKDWKYRNIDEVLLYPGSFDQDFRIQGTGRDTLGMVGNGPMQRVMILSKSDLRRGFTNSSDTSNPAIHEFVHLIDKSDGSTDGLPEVLLQHSYSMPWLHRMSQEIEKIHEGKSDINPYGTKNEAEFLAVAAEYFFKQPEKMHQRHPELYGMLSKIFMR